MIPEFVIADDDGGDSEVRSGVHSARGPVDMEKVRPLGALVAHNECAGSCSKHIVVDAAVKLLGQLLEQFAQIVGRVWNLGRHIGHSRSGHGVTIDGNLQSGAF